MPLETKNGQEQNCLIKQELKVKNKKHTFILKENKTPLEKKNNNNPKEKKTNQLNWELRVS